MPPDSHCPNIDVLQQFVRGRLAPRDKAVVEDHAAHCPECTRLLNILRSVSRLGASMQVAGQPGDCFDPDTLQLFARGKLPRAEARAVQHHVQQCALCSQIVHVFQTLARPSVAIPGLDAGDAAPPGTRQDAMPRQRTLPTSEAPSSSLLITSKEFAFLAPAQQPGELGRLGPYRILKVLGEGGMGVVFQAEDSTLERMVALKVMKPEGSASKAARERFLQEAKAAASIQHDHIVTIYQVGEDWGVPFLAMQFLQGESLESRLEREGRLPVTEVVRIGRETAEGLAAAHERGLIHRDIKPGNLWLESRVDRAGVPMPGRVKILDFGLARIAGAIPRNLTQAGFVVGTPGYMAPEQARAGQPLDGRCDLFSLGCVLYRMAAGRDAFQGDDAVSLLLAVALEQPEPLLKLNSEVPPELAQLINWLLQKYPDARPATARQLVELLSRIERPLLGPARSEDSARSTRDRPGRLQAAVDDVGVTPWETGYVSAKAARGTQRDAAAESASSEAPSTSPQWNNSLGVCPRCGTRRSASGLTTWCLSCGYYPEPEKPPEPEPQMGGWIPGWAWILMLGTVAVFGLSVAGHYYLSPKMGNRAWWALGELSVGVVLMVVGTVWGFVKSLPQREEYTVFQLIDPTRLIEYTIRSLPDTRRPVWLGAWGLTAVLCSVFIIGGLSHFLARPRPRANPTLDLADTARERLQQQMEDFADSDDLPSERPATASADPDRDTATDLDEEDDGGKPRRFSLHCVVVGYVPDKDGNISRLVLATEHDGKYQFAGLAVPSADSPSTAQKLQQLKELVTTDRPPIVVEKIKPVWVKPELACEVRYGERGPDGTLQRSQIKNWTK